MNVTPDTPSLGQRDLIERRFRRFTAQLPITVLTNPVPPYWFPLRFKGETIEVARGGASAQFQFDVTRFLYRAKSVRLLLGHGEHLGTHQTINARVAWANGSQVGFEFTRILREDPLRRVSVANFSGPDPYTE